VYDSGKQHPSNDCNFQYQINSPNRFDIVKISNQKIMIDLSPEMSRSKEMYAVQIRYVHTTTT